MVGSIGFATGLSKGIANGAPVIGTPLFICKRLSFGIAGDFVCGSIVSPSAKGSKLFLILNFVSLLHLIQNF